MFSKLLNVVHIVPKILFFFLSNNIFRIKENKSYSTTSTFNSGSCEIFPFVLPIEAIILNFEHSLIHNSVAITVYNFGFRFLLDKGNLFRLMYTVFKTRFFSIKLLFST